MKIPLEFYELLRSRINLSDVASQRVILTKKSGNYVGLCPFHTEKSPSFTVSNSKRFYYCFGCAAHGDVIRFVANSSGLSYKESAIKLANDYNIELPKLTKEEQQRYEESDEILEILELATEFFKSQLSPDIINYLSGRGISKETIKEFSIGFAPPGKKLQKFFEEKSIPLMKLERAGLVSKNESGRLYELFYDRIIFPIKNIYDKTIGFGGRVIGNGLPKYLNSPETIVFQKSEILYGENKAISAAYKKNYSILVEGYLDVIALHQSGFKEALASLGTAVTENHLQKLWRASDEIIVCLDGDNAGIKASLRVINLALPLITATRKISFIRLPNSNDPDDIINKQGVKAFTDLIDKRMNLSEMIWHTEYFGKTFGAAEDKAILEKNLETYCKQITDKTLSSNYYRFFKDQIWQNLIKRQSKTTIKSSKVIDSSPNYSEIEMLEQVFCSILIKMPELLQEESIKNFLSTLNFQNEELSDFRDWYFEEVINNNIMEREYIIKLVEKTRFYDRFLLLSESNNLFLDISSYKDNIDTNLLWQWLYKKYYLILLKQEYTSNIHSGFDEEFKKATLYQEEIIKISKELQKLNESFIN